MMGLASGMDTDFIIQQTLRMHQFKIDNQMRNRKLIEWRQQTHNTIKDEISSLRQTFLSNLGSRSMMNRNAFNSTLASVTGTNASKVSIRTNAGSPLGNFSIDRVVSLARGQHLNTTGGVSANNNGFATTARLGDLNFKQGGIEWTQSSGTIRVGNENVTIHRGTEDIIEEIDGEDVVTGTKDVWTVRNQAGEDVGGGWDGTGPLTITAGGTTRTINWDEGNNRFIEDRVGVFSQNFTLPGVDGGADRNITITATQNQETGVWSFNTGSNSVTATLDDENNLIVRFGTGDGDVHNLGEWDATNQTLDDGDTVTSFNQVTQPAVQLVDEAILNFNGTNVTIRASDTLSDMITRVNNSGAGVHMSYDRLTDQFILEARNGVGGNPLTSSLEISSDSNFFQLISGSSAPISLQAGQRAEVWINNKQEFFDSNNFDFRGVSITLNDTFTTEGPVNVNLTRDTDRAFNAIKDFIDSYNSIIRRLEGLLSERKTGSEVSYKPLTDEEKQGMTDRQIEEWESIARKGILRNDQGIQNLVSSLRRTFFENIEGLGVSPAQIGLTTGSFFDGTGGQIMIDEERLRGAIERDPDMVADIFIRIDTSEGSPRGVGLLHRIDGLMRDYVNVSQATSTRNLEDSLKRTNEQIQRLQERMFAEEDRLYRVFASMETAMQKLNQQGAWFSSMLGQ